MSLVTALNEFNADVAQCDNLIENAHRTDSGGNMLFSSRSQQQITIAAFLNMYVAWETFLETSLIQFMVGATTLSGKSPVRYVCPVDQKLARSLVIGCNRYFDFGNHENVKRMVNLYFENGYPYEPHLSAIFSDLADLRTMRNASAHITSTTQTALDGLALRIFSKPVSNISLYSMLTAVDPRLSAGETVFFGCKSKLSAAAELIATG